MSVIESLPELFHRPHCVLDTEGRMVSGDEVHKVIGLKRVDIRDRNGKVKGYLHCDPKLSKKFLEFFVQHEEPIDLVQDYIAEHSYEIYKKNLLGLLCRAASKDCTLDDLLVESCNILRSFFLSKRCSVYLVENGHTLKGLVGSGPGYVMRSTDNWKNREMNIASMAIRERKPYVCQEPERDPNYRHYGTAEMPENLICFPLLQNNEPIGILNMSSKLTGDFEPEDLQMIRQGADVIGQILKTHYEIQRAEKMFKTSANLGQYLSKNVVRQIAETGTTGKLGGETKHVVCLFSDIRSFSTITEGMDAALLVELLNFYFDEMSRVIEKYNGTLDKLVGDLIMVLWNVPVPQPDAEVLAVRAAIDMQKAIIQKVAPKWRENGVSNFGVGIGINSGPAVAGNLGSKHFRNYTVIGNTINSSQRLEAQAPAGEIWVHEDVFAKVEGKVPKFERIEKEVHLKGISKAVQAYVFKPLI